MAQLVTGRFDDVDQVKRTLNALQAAGFDKEQYGVFYVSPPGQHDKYPIGGDAMRDAGTEHSAPGAVAGVAVGGGAGIALGAAVAAAVPIAGIAAVLAGAGVGAYIGSFMGAMSQTKDADPAASTTDAPAESLGGIRIAVNVDGMSEDAALRALAAGDAMDIARAEGVFRKGEWKDFDPRTPPA